MADWKSLVHLEDHFELHRRELRVRSLGEYDASAQETISIGIRFTYIDNRTRERRIGYFHRATSRFVATTVDDLIVTHFLTDEGVVASYIRSTYRDD